MSVPEGKSRISITLGNAVIEKLDKYCEQSGLTRSAVIGSMLGTNLGVMERMTAGIEKELAGALLRAAMEGRE